MFVPWWIIAIVAILFLWALSSRTGPSIHISGADLDARLTDLEDKVDSLLEHFGLDEPTPDDEETDEETEDVTER